MNNSRAKSDLDFVNLHTHTTFSVFDGMGYPEDYLRRSWEIGCEALAISEHGNMNSFPYFYLAKQKLAKEGIDIKNIYACECYIIDSLDVWKDDVEKAAAAKKTKKNKKEASEDEDFGDTEKGRRRSKVNRYSHILLMAYNQTGLENLFKMISQSYKKPYFYRRPRIDHELLKEHSEGLIISTACMGGVLGEIYFAYRDKGPEAVLTAMKAESKRFIEMVGSERFYGELQWSAQPEQHEINQFVIKTAQDVGFELISTIDCHYPRPELWKDRELYVQIGWLNKKSDKKALPQSPEEIPWELYPKNGDEMWETYKRYSAQAGFEYDDDVVRKSITNTYRIAFEQIEEIEPKTDIKLPDFVVKGKTAGEELEELCWIGMKEKGLEKKEEYRQRLKYELSVIHERAFSKYFLTVKTIVDKAREHMMVGPGRGSGAGSLVSYVLRITQLDPIKNRLPFERFLTIPDKNAKIGFPDIDVDISRPDDLKEMLIKEWGEDCVVRISNFNTLQLRSLIKDVSKFYDIPFSEVNVVTNAMLSEATPAAKRKHGIKVGVYNPTFEEVKEFSTTLQKFFRKYPHVATHIDNLHGQIRNTSTHAGRILVCEGLNEKMPLINVKGKVQTPWAEGQNVRHLEPLGFIKIDMLGLKTLVYIERAIFHILKKELQREPSWKEINEYYDKHLQPDVVGQGEEKVFKNVFEDSGKMGAGVFQFSQRGAQNFCKKVAPKNIRELSAVTSIYRPGPLGAGVHKTYIKAKKAPEKVKYAHSVIRDVLEEDFGHIIYQETLGYLAAAVGDGISLNEGNTLRKLLIKKGIGEVEEKKTAIKEKFERGGIAKGIPEEEVSKLWESMENFAKYGFCKSHSTAYCNVSYQCAWLLYYYSAEWMAAVLDGTDDVAKAISIAQQNGFNIKRADINESTDRWEILDDGVTLVQPFSSLKGLGETAVEQIMHNRPFLKIEDVLFGENIIKSKLNKKCLDVLIRSGALDSLVDDRFSGRKHFWSAVAVDRPNSEKQFNGNIELYYPEGDFENEERVRFVSSLSGLYPLDMVVSAEMTDKLKECKIPPIGEFDKDLQICWFIPKDMMVKKTKFGKPYWIIMATDDTGATTDIKVWGVGQFDRLRLHRAYIAKLDYDSKWGLSSRNFQKDWRVI